MKPQAVGSHRNINRALIWFAAGLLATPAIATAQSAYVIQPVIEKKLKDLPVGPLYWRVENFHTLADARAAESPASLSAEVAGKVWLFTLGPKGSAITGGSNAVEIGPVLPINATNYMLRINYVSAPPGAKTSVHTHPGSETFYVLTGQLGQKSSHGEKRVEAGQSMAGNGPGTPMEVFNSGSSDLTALVMFVVDASKPFSSAAKFD